MRTVTINHKQYTVQRVFNMVANYEFTDKKGAVYLVDAEDIQIWNEEENGLNRSSIDDAIAYARYYSDESEDGVFWWKVK